MHIYEIRPCKHKRGVDLISDVLPSGRLSYGGPSAVSDAVAYAHNYSRSDDVVISVYDATGNVLETHVYRKNCKES